MGTVTYNKTRNISKLTNVGLALHRRMLNIETAGRLEIACDMKATGLSVRSIAMAKKISIIFIVGGRGRNVSMPKIP